MKRSISIGTLTATIMLALSSSVALAAVRFGTEGWDLLFGTSEKDVLYGRGGEDVMHGGDENDDIASFDVGSRRDIVSCGGGKDRAFADFRDRVADDCEKVFRRRG